MISKAPFATRSLLIGIALLAVSIPLAGCDGSGTEVTATAVVQKVTLRADKPLLPEGGGSTDLIAEVTNTTGGPVANVEVVFTTTAGTLEPGNRATTNGSGRARVKLETDKVARVQAAVLSIVSNEIEVRIDDPVIVEVAVVEGAIEVGEQVTIEITVQEEEKATPVGTAEIDWGDGDTRTVKVEGTVEVTHTYITPGEYQVKVTFTSDESGTTASDTEIIEVLEEVLEIALSVTATPSEPVAGEPVTFNFTAEREDGEPGKGDLKIDFDDGTIRTFKNVSGEGSVQHTYQETGQYNVRARLENSNGNDPAVSRNLRVVERPSGAAGNDAIDPFSINYLHANISRWRQTSTVQGINIEKGQVCIHHSKSGQWPVDRSQGERNATEGNPWVFARIGGQWYGGTFEWLRPGQECKRLDSEPPEITIKDKLGPSVKIEPMKSWKPKKGELVGFAVSTLARDSRRTGGNQRSNIDTREFPY